MIYGYTLYNWNISPLLSIFLVLYIVTVISLVLSNGYHKKATQCNGIPDQYQKYGFYLHFFTLYQQCNMQTDGLEPGWLGASFGLRISYVRIIITRIFAFASLNYHIYY